MIKYLVINEIIKEAYNSRMPYENIVGTQFTFIVVSTLAPIAISVLPYFREKQLC